MAKDYEIGDIRSYGDWAEYECDIRGTQVLFRPLAGAYPDSFKVARDFEILTEEEMKEG